MQDHVDYFEIFPWNENFGTSITLIDEQHRQLVTILNQLAAHLAHRSCPITLNQIFNNLADYADYHFKTEEAIWRSYLDKDIWFDNHIETHREFISKINELAKEKDLFSLDKVIGDTVSYLTHWLAYHILESDKRMAKTVLAIQSGLSIEKAKAFADQEMSGAMHLMIETVLTMYDDLSSRTMELMREKAARKQAEEALRVSEERWNVILNNAGDGLWDWNIKNGEIFGVGITSKIIGLLTGNEGTGESGLKIHPDDFLRLKTDLQKHLEGLTDSFVNEHRLLRNDGSCIWMITRGKVISHDAKGHPLRMIGSHTDVTELTLAQLVFKNSGEAIMITDDKHNIVAINPCFTKVTGYTHEEVVGKSADIIGSRLDDEASRKAMWRESDFSGYWKGEVLNKRKNGENYPSLFSICSVKNPDGTISHQVCIFSDITKQSKTACALKESENRLQSIVNSALDAIILSADDGSIIAWHDQAEQIFGWRQDEVLGQSIHELIIPARYHAAHLAGMQNFLATGKGPALGKRIEMTALHRDGHEFPVDLAIAAHWRDGRYEFSAFIRDITERKLAEEKQQSLIRSRDRAMEDGLLSVATALEQRDPYTAGHQQRVAELAMAIAKVMGLSDHQIHGIRLAGIVHDIGKIQTPAEILTRPVRLSQEEYALIKMHAQNGYEILRGVDFPWPIAQVALQHHERMDGSGYPQGLKGEQIILEARIIAVADVIESMAFNRPYRHSVGMEKALEEINRNRGLYYDPDVVDACLKLFRERGFVWSSTGLNS